MNKYTIAYYGKKNTDYISIIKEMMPEYEISHFVETCGGSCNFSVNYASNNPYARVTVLEKNRELFTLHYVTKEVPDVLVNEVEKIEYLKEKFDWAVEYLKMPESERDAVKTALAMLIKISFSYNGMRQSFRSLDSWKKYTDTFKKMEVKSRMEKMARNCIKNMEMAIKDCSEVFKNIEMLNADFMDFPEYWSENKETFVFCDIPYCYASRGIFDKRRSAGYEGEDWGPDKYNQFKKFLMDYVFGLDNTSSIMICQCYEQNEGGELGYTYKKGDKNKWISIKDDDFVKFMLQHGFRLVEVLNKSTSAIISNKDGEVSKKRKKRKVEVVFINYFFMNEYKFRIHTYESVYGEKHTGEVEVVDDVDQTHPVEIMNNSQNINIKAEKNIMKSEKYIKEVGEYSIITEQKTGDFDIVYGRKACDKGYRTGFTIGDDNIVVKDGRTERELERIQIEWSRGARIYMHKIFRELNICSDYSLGKHTYDVDITKDWKAIRYCIERGIPLDDNIYQKIKEKTQVIEENFGVTKEDIEVGVCKSWGISCNQ